MVERKLLKAKLNKVETIHPRAIMPPLESIMAEMDSFYERKESMAIKWILNPPRASLLVNCLSVTLNLLVTFSLTLSRGGFVMVRFVAL